MHQQDFFYQAVIYLLAAVVSVALAKRLGLGSVLGYLLAGIVIGPFVFGLVGSEDSSVMHFAEFGVVMMLFLIGLELRPSLLWKMRKSIFGLGGLQVLLTTLIIAAIALGFKSSFKESLAIGLVVALSSTAIVLQTLTEKGLIKNEGGKASFSVLLFQDIAVIPILALIPLLAPNGIEVANDHATHGIAALPGWQQVLIIIAVVAGIIFIGRFLARYIFRVIASSGMREIFTASALLLVISTAIAMDMVGLSPALGTFLAGVVLADNEYRHELESGIEPFKGLLLGLFFISVGASINFNILFENPVSILVFLVILVAVKFTVLYGLGKAFGLKKGNGLLFSFALAQGGEFAFVLISFSSQNKVLSDELSGVLLIVVALSMLITPFLLIINEKFIQPRILFNANKEEDADEIEDSENQVIIAGFGRFGLAIGRFLKANGIHTTVLDNNSANIEMLRKFGFKVYYGDATRHDLLLSAGIKNAKILIIAIDNEEEILKLIDYVKDKYPHVKILSRSKGLRHTFELKKRNVFAERRETYDASIELATTAMHELGYSKYQAYSSARTFKKHDELVLEELYQLWGKDEQKYISEAKRFSEQLRNLLLSEEENFYEGVDSAWDVQTLRDEVLENYNKQQD
ncbi:MAG: cation:proton antiporter [Salinivirgaceae bacterium]|nr:cation:proton antiporter [Salinivirgaceae bacterium]